MRLGRSALAFAGHGGERLGRRRPQRLRVPQALPLWSELRLLGRIGVRGLDLLQLEAQDVEIALAGALPLPDPSQLALDPKHLGVRLPIGAAPLQVLLAGEAVQRLELRARQRQLAVLVLPVEGEQPRAQGLQLGRRGRAAREKRARSPARRDAPPDGDLGRALRQPLRDLGQLRIAEQPLGNLEHPLHVGLGRARPDDVRARLAAHQQVEGVGQDRLARSRLARDRVQPRPESQLGALDQEQVLDPELEEHVPLVLTLSLRRILPRLRHQIAATGGS